MTEAEKTALGTEISTFSSDIPNEEFLILLLDLVNMTHLRENELNSLLPHVSPSEQGPDLLLQSLCNAK